MSLVKNSSIIAIGTIVSLALSYVFHIFVARFLGPADYGVFGAAVSLVGLLGIIMSAVATASTKFTAKLNENKEYGKMNFFKSKMQKGVFIFSAIIFLFIVMLSGMIAGYLKISSFLVMLSGVVFVFSLVLAMNRGFLQGMKKFRVYSINSVFESVLRFIIVALFLFFGLGVSGALLSYGVGYIFSFLIIYPFIKVKGKEEKIKMNSVLRFMFVVIAINLALQIALNFPTLIIKHYASSEFTGYWTAALNISKVTLHLAGAVGLAMFPEVAGNNQTEFRKRNIKKAVLLTLIVSIGMALGFLVFSDLAVLILYGKEFMPASILLKYLGIAMIFLSLLQLYIGYWLAKR